MNNNKQQTAVKWLVEQLYAPCRGIPSHIIEKAKAMEKEQILDAVDYGPDFNKAIDYYNETFNNKP